MLKNTPKNERNFQELILKTLLKRRSKEKRRRMLTSEKKMKWPISSWMKKKLMRTEPL